ncbi:c-type cytochrome [Mesobacillus campisalis]|uniref:c-type cytochrome n=1 Tax=Mesobacillus campisalis TaxID=1408103 RepID=UPI00069B780B|nr:c-type cytochrome [Mesobacillus campisalis]
MRKIIFWLSAAGIILAVAVTAFISQMPSKEEKVYIQQGEKLYNQLCLACHGENGKGEGTLAGTALNNQNYLSIYTNEDLSKHIEDGRPEAMMPEYGSILEKEQIGQLVSYIRSWQTKPVEMEALTAFDGDPLNGGKLFNLYCANCHGLTGSGLKGTATAITHPNRLEQTTDEQMWLSAAYGRENTRMGPSLKGLEGVRQLEEQQITDIISYIRQDLVKNYDPRESQLHPSENAESNTPDEKEPSTNQ